MKSLFSALQKTEQPPCERGGICPNFDSCAGEKLACNDFLRYVTKNNKGKHGRSPSRDIYVKIYREVQ